MTIKRAPTSSRGVAHGLAVAIGIPPELAVPAGERAVAAMMALKQARDAGGGGLRQHHVARAQQHIAALDPTQHGPLVQRLQAHVLAMQGRGCDTRLAHVTPGEVVVPQRLQTPEIALAIQRVAQQRGVDPARLRVGSGSNVINPRTGQMEFDDWDNQGVDGVDGGDDVTYVDVTKPGTDWTPTPDNEVVPLHPPSRPPIEDITVEGTKKGPSHRGQPEQSHMIEDPTADYAQSPIIPDWGPLPDYALPESLFPRHDGKTGQWIPPDASFTPVPPPTPLPWPPNYDHFDENDRAHIFPRYSSGRYNQT